MVFFSTDVQHGYLTCFQNSVRHNLSLNKCFEKIENSKASGSSRKGCLWGLHPAKIEKMEEEIAKWRKKDPAAIKRSMAKPGRDTMKGPTYWVTGQGFACQVVVGQYYRCNM